MPTLMTGAPTEVLSQKKVEEFNRIFDESVKAGLVGFLGEGTTASLLYHLQLTGYQRSPQDFHSKLASILMLGTVVAERAIAAELSRRLNSRFQESAIFDFDRWVGQARKAFLEQA